MENLTQVTKQVTEQVTEQVTTSIKKRGRKPLTEEQKLISLEKKKEYMRVRRELNPTLKVKKENKLDIIHNLLLDIQDKLNNIYSEK